MFNFVLLHLAHSLDSMRRGRFPEFGGKKLGNELMKKFKTLQFEFFFKLKVLLKFEK